MGTSSKTIAHVGAISANNDKTIGQLIEVFGVTQVMVGSDYPFAIMDADPAARVLSLSLSSPSAGSVAPLDRETPR